jgi:hypothetical protein
MTAIDRQGAHDTELGRAGRLTNWILALATIPGAIAVVVFLYMEIQHCWMQRSAVPAPGSR